MKLSPVQRHFMMCAINSKEAILSFDLSEDDFIATYGYSKEQLKSELHSLYCQLKIAQINDNLAALRFSVEPLSKKDLRARAEEWVGSLVNGGWVKHAEVTKVDEKTQTVVYEFTPFPKIKNYSFGADKG